MNVESRNMVESAGNYIRHRRAPIVIWDRTTKQYVIRYVPAISGESIAHGFQKNLAEIAKKMGIKEVCPLCEQGIFIKRGVPDHAREIKKSLGNITSKELAQRFEEEVIKRCIVEDIGGFMFPGESDDRFPVKRTSKISFGYIIPAIEDLVATLEPQFHARQDPDVQRGQMIYYNEVGSAIYVIQSGIELSGIGKTSMFEVKQVVSNEDLKRRVNATLKALYLTIGLGKFGAKNARFEPDYQIKSIVAAISEARLNVISGHSVRYLIENYEQVERYAKIVGTSVTLLYYADRDEEELLRKLRKSLPESRTINIKSIEGNEVSVKVIKTNSVNEFFEKLFIEVMSIMKF